MELDSLKSSEIETLVGAEIRAEAARHRLPLAFLAAKAGVSRQTFSRKINGQMSFRLKEVNGVANYFGLTASELIARAEHALAASTKEGDEQ